MGLYLVGILLFEGIDVTRISAVAEAAVAIIGGIGIGAALGIIALWMCYG